MHDDTTRRHLPLAPHDFEILLCLSREPLHGYAIIADIRDRTRGDIVLGTSTLYAAVRRLRRGELIDEDDSRHPGSQGPPRRYWRITPLGREVLMLEAERIRRTAAAADALLGGSPARAGE